MASTVPLLNDGGLLVQCVHKSKYLGHIINTNLTYADDIQRELCNLFIQTNSLARKFSIFHLMLRYIIVQQLLCLLL